MPLPRKKSRKLSNFKRTPKEKIVETDDDDSERTVDGKAPSDIYENSKESSSPSKKRGQSPALSEEEDDLMKSSQTIPKNKKLKRTSKNEDDCNQQDTTETDEESCTISAHTKDDIEGVNEQVEDKALSENLEWTVEENDFPGFLKSDMHLQKNKKLLQIIRAESSRDKGDEDNLLHDSKLDFFILQDCQDVTEANIIQECQEVAEPKLDEDCNVVAELKTVHDSQVAEHQFTQLSQEVTIKLVKLKNVKSETESSKKNPILLKKQSISKSQKDDAVVTVKAIHSNKLEIDNVQAEEDNRCFIEQNSGSSIDEIKASGKHIQNERGNHCQEDDSLVLDVGCDELSLDDENNSDEAKAKKSKRDDSLVLDVGCDELSLDDENNSDEAKAKTSKHDDLLVLDVGYDELSLDYEYDSDEAEAKKPKPVAVASRKKAITTDDSKIYSSERDGRKKNNSTGDHSKTKDIDMEDIVILDVDSDNPIDEELFVSKRSKEKLHETPVTKAKILNEKSVKPKIPGASFLVLIKGRSKRMEFVCTLCFDKFDTHKVVHHIRSIPHLLKVLCVEDDNLYKKYKENLSISSRELFKIVLEIESNLPESKIQHGFGKPNEKIFGENMRPYLYERAKAVTTLLNKKKQEEEEVKLLKCLQNNGKRNYEKIVFLVPQICRNSFFEDIILEDFEFFLYEVGENLETRNDIKRSLSDGKRFLLIVLYDPTVLVSLKTAEICDDNGCKNPLNYLSFKTLHLGNIKKEVDKFILDLNLSLGKSLLKGSDFMVVPPFNFFFINYSSPAHVRVHETSDICSTSIISRDIDGTTLLQCQQFYEIVHKICLNYYNIGYTHPMSPFYEKIKSPVFDLSKIDASHDSVQFYTSLKDILFGLLVKPRPVQVLPTVKNYQNESIENPQNSSSLVLIGTKRLLEKISSFDCTLSNAIRCEIKLPFCIANFKLKIMELDTSENDTHFIIFFDGSNIGTEEISHQCVMNGCAEPLKVTTFSPGPQEAVIEKFMTSINDLSKHLHSLNKTWKVLLMPLFPIKVRSSGNVLLFSHLNSHLFHRLSIPLNGSICEWKSLMMLLNAKLRTQAKASFEEKGLPFHTLGELYSDDFFPLIFLKKPSILAPEQQSWKTIVLKFLSVHVYPWIRKQEGRKIQLDKGSEIEKNSNMNGSTEAGKELDESSVKKANLASKSKNVKIFSRLKAISVANTIYKHKAHHTKAFILGPKGMVDSLGSLPQTYTKIYVDNIWENISMILDKFFACISDRPNKAACFLIFDASLGISRRSHTQILCSKESCKIPISFTEIKSADDALIEKGKSDLGFLMNQLSKKIDTFILPLYPKVIFFHSSNLKTIDHEIAHRLPTTDAFISFFIGNKKPSFYSSLQGMWQEVLEKKYKSYPLSKSVIDEYITAKRNIFIEGKGIDDITLLWNETNVWQMFSKVLMASLVKPDAVFSDNGTLSKTSNLTDKGTTSSISSLSNIATTSASISSNVNFGQPAIISEALPPAPPIEYNHASCPPPPGVDNFESAATNSALAMKTGFDSSSFGAASTSYSGLGGFGMQSSQARTAAIGSYNSATAASTLNAPGSLNFASTAPYSDNYTNFGLPVTNFTTPPFNITPVSYNADASYTPLMQSYPPNIAGGTSSLDNNWASTGPCAALQTNIAPLPQGPTPATLPIGGLASPFFAPTHAQQTSSSNFEAAASIPPSYAKTDDNYMPIDVPPPPLPIDVPPPPLHPLAKFTVMVKSVSSVIPKEFFEAVAKMFQRNFVSIKFNEDKILIEFDDEKTAEFISNKLNRYRIADVILETTQLYDRSISHSFHSGLDEKFASICAEFYRMIIENIEEKLNKVVDISSFKTKECTLNCGNSMKCQFYHSETDTRRDPFKFEYSSAIICRTVKMGQPCFVGSRCLMSHSKIEQSMHPGRYQKKICAKGPLCKRRPFCINAHKDSPEMFYHKLWKDCVTPDLWNSFAYLAGAVRGICKYPKMKDEKVIFFTAHTNIIHFAEESLRNICTHHKLTCLTLDRNRTPASNWNVLIGLPSLISRQKAALFQDDTKLAAIIIDDVSAIFSKGPEKACLAALFSQFKSIMKGNFAKINKVFVVEGGTESKAVSDISNNLRIPIDIVITKEVYFGEEAKMSSKDDRSNIGSDSSMPALPPLPQNEWHQPFPPLQQSSATFPPLQQQSSATLPSAKKRETAYDDNVAGPNKISVASAESQSRPIFSSAREEKTAREIDEEFLLYEEVPEIHPLYEKIFASFNLKYSNEFPNQLGEKHKEFEWQKHWKAVLNVLKRREVENKLKKNENKITEPPSTSFETANKPHGPTEDFSIEKNFQLLEQHKNKMGRIGHSLLTIFNNCRSKGTTTPEGLAVFSDPDVQMILNIVIENLSKSMNSDSISLRPVYNAAIDGAERLLNLSKEQQKLSQQTTKVQLTKSFKEEPKTQSSEIDVQSIAKATLGKDPPAIINFIKTAMTYSGVLNPSSEELNKVYLKVVSFQVTL